MQIGPQDLQSHPLVRPEMSMERRVDLVVRIQSHTLHVFHLRPDVHLAGARQDVFGHGTPYDGHVEHREQERGSHVRECAISHGFDGRTVRYADLGRLTGR